MARDITTNLATQISAETSELLYFMMFNFYNDALAVEEPTYITTAPHDIATTSATLFATLPLASYTWAGVGGNIGFQVVQETTDIAGNGIDIILSGVDQTILGYILGKKYIGRFVRVWLAHLSDADKTIIASPKLIFYGRMNGGFEIKERKTGDVPGTVEINCRATDRLGDFQRIAGIQTNLESHQKHYPNDKFFEFVDEMMGKTIRWGES